MLMSKSAPHPRSRKTPRGGRMTARMILQISDAVKGILVDWYGKGLCFGYEVVEVLRRLDLYLRSRLSSLYEKDANGGSKGSLM